MAAFNLENYLENSRKVDLSEFDFSQAREYALTPDEIRCLEYMMDVESSTIVYLRAVLRTCIIDDPESVAFLSCWAYEEYFHGRTIREFLKASGVEVRSDRYVQVKRNATFRERLTQLRKGYEPYSYALAQELLMELPPWLPMDGRKDNWETTAWEGSAPGESLR